MNERYDAAKKVIQILVKNKVINGSAHEEEYLKVWDAALEIVEELIMINEE